MSLRAQTITAIILLATLSLVFILVSGVDLQTNVFSAEPTATAIPPTPTTAAAGSADNWQQDENQPTRWTYTGQEGIPAELVVEEMTLAQVATSLQASPPAADAPLPLLDILGQFREGVAAELGPTVQISEPSIQVFGGVPVALLHITSEADEATFPTGIDYTLALVDQDDDNVTYIQSVYQGPPNDQLYQDFRAWLDTYAPEFAAAGDAAETTADATPAPADSTPSSDATAAPGEQPESGTATEAAPTPIAAEPTTVPTAEPAADTNPEAPAAEPTGEPRTEADATPAAAQPTWTEVGPGQVLYTGSPDVLAQIVYGQVRLEDFVAQGSLEMPAGDSDAPTLDVLQQVIDQLTQQIEAQDIALAEDAITGPEMLTFGDVPVALARVKIGPQTLADGQPFPGNDLGLGLIDVGDGQLQTVQFLMQGEPDDVIYEQFLSWLTDNVEMLAVPEDLAPTATPAAEPTAVPEGE